MDGTDAAAKPCPQRDDHNRFEATTPHKRLGRQIQLPIRYKENNFITSMLNVVQPSSYKEASQYSEWKETIEDEYESIQA